MAIGQRLKHVIESQQFTRELLEQIMTRASEMEREPHRAAGRLQGRVMAALFYEPSTRTRLSFKAAMLRLAGSALGADHAPEISRPANRETLDDPDRNATLYATVNTLRPH